MLLRRADAKLLSNKDFNSGLQIRLLISQISVPMEKILGHHFSRWTYFFIPQIGQTSGKCLKGRD